MKFLKIMVSLLALILIIGTSACSIGQAANTQSQSTVIKGDIAAKVNGTGKTGYANESNLAFGIAGKVEKINVKKGDFVSQGMVLAKLETDNAELALLQAKVALGQTQKALAQAEIGVTQAQITLSQAQSARAQAEASATAAQFNLDKIQAVGEIKDKIMKSEMLISAAEVNRRQANATGDSEERRYLDTYLDELHQELDEQKVDLQVLLGQAENSDVAPYEIITYNPLTQTYSLDGQTYDRLVVEDIRMKQLQLEAALLAVEQAKLNVEQSTQSIELAKQTVEQSKLVLEQNSKAVEVAQKQLDEATIVAPFNGTVASIDIKQGDYVGNPGLSAVTPIHLVDTGSLEISTEVDEIDIAGVQVNQPAKIKLEAFTNTVFDGVVTSVSVTPKERAQSSGIVIYDVKVALADISQAQIKSGMSASVDIITAEKKAVLLVPNKYIKQNSQGQKIVNILVDQKYQEQTVTLGLTDGAQTEIVSGLKEGDVVYSTP